MLAVTPVDRVAERDAERRRVDGVKEAAENYAMRVTREYELARERKGAEPAPEGAVAEMRNELGLAFLAGYLAAGEAAAAAADRHEVRLAVDARRARRKR